ncbi:MAG: rod shape-determining protein MreD [Elusimicrobia bacterium]|nr:rod shape-determining protein MreD [Elusimicrobiota bacterium]
MKKPLFYFTSIIIIIISEILLSKFSFIGLIFIVFVGLYRGASVGCSVGFFIGLLEGVFSTTSFGVGSFSYSIVGYLAGHISRRIDEENPLAQIIIVFLTIILNWVISSIIETLFTGIQGLFYLDWKIVFVVLSPLYFWILKKWWFFWFKKLEVER